MSTKNQDVINEESVVADDSSEVVETTLNAVVLSAVIAIKEDETDTVETNPNLGVVLKEDQMVNLQYTFWTIADNNTDPMTKEGWDTIMILLSGDGVHTIAEMIYDPSKYSSHIITGVNVIKDLLRDVANTKYPPSSDNYQEKVANLTQRSGNFPMLVSGYMGKDISHDTSTSSLTDMFKCYMEGGLSSMLMNRQLVSKMTSNGNTSTARYSNLLIPTYKLFCDQIWGLENRIAELETSMQNDVVIQAKVQ